MDLPPVLSEQLLALADEPLGPMTTLGVGGPAPWVLEPRTRPELVLAVEQLSAAGLPFRLLGGGSNLLIDDAGVPEVVIRTTRMAGIYHHGEREHALRAEAGASLTRFVSMCRDLGLGGAEGLVGIPGTVGGAVAGNAGGAHGWISELVTAVTLVEPDGSVREVAVSPDDFGYRSSPFQHGAAVILDAVLQLEPRPPRRVLERMTAVLQAKRENQPLSSRSSGCMFRNSADVPSGRLIDEAGCKGLAVGAARVSERHANFVVNEGGARAADVFALVERVRAEVRRTSGTELRLEVEVWPSA